MLQVLNRLVDICLLRRGPQDLPASTLLTGTLLVLYAGLVMLAESLFFETGDPWAWTGISLALMAAALYLLLTLRGVTARFAQTFAAYCGCGALYLAVYLPLALVLNSSPDDGVPILTSILVMVWIVLLFWGFLIEGNIYRHALNLSLPAGVLLSVLSFAAFSALHRAMYPEAP